MGTVIWMFYSLVVDWMEADPAFVTKDGKIEI